MNDMTKREAGAVAVVKGYLKNEDIKKRLEDILGKKANGFGASIVNAVSTNTALQKCDPNSIMSAAFVAAALDLPIDQNLGFAAIVPYGGKAQFQMMYKGFIQLAMRSGQYRGMNYAEIYADEIELYDPITKRVKFVKPRPVDGNRHKGETDKIVGYYSWFELMNGFFQEMFMTCDEIRLHARKYSKSYQYDLKDNSRGSRWSTDFDVMAAKTVIKLLLSKWGILSIEMQKALSEDQKVFRPDGSSDYGDSPVDETTLPSVADPFKNTNDQAKAITEMDDDPDFKNEVKEHERKMAEESKK